MCGGAFWVDRSWGGLAEKTTGHGGGRAVGVPPPPRAGPRFDPAFPPRHQRVETPRPSARAREGWRAGVGRGRGQKTPGPTPFPSCGQQRRRCPTPLPTFTHLAKRPDAQRLAQPVVGQEEVGRGSRAGRRARVGGGAGAGVGLHGGWVGRGGGPTGPRVAGGVKERVGMRNWGGGGGHPKRKKKTGGRGCEVFTPPRFDSRTPPARRRQINPAHTHRRNTLGANTGNHTRKKSSTKST